MDSKRAVKATGVFVVLSLLFSGLVGFVSASSDPAVFVPVPRPGDSAYYVIREVVDDEEIARGAVDFDWARLTWLDEVEVTDDTGAQLVAQPARMEVMFKQGTEYEIDFVRTGHFTPVEGKALFDEYDVPYRLPGMDPYFCLPADCMGGYEEIDGDLRVRKTFGPVGLCGIRTPLHGAGSLPPMMEVPGYCRDIRTIQDEPSTEYRFIEHTVWKDRDAVVYEAADTGYRITYAEGISAPVFLEIPLAELIYEPYTLGRHFSLELRAVQMGQDLYQNFQAYERADPVRIIPRDPVLQIDDSDLDGFLLADAFAAAMNDMESPRMSDFMQRTGSYLGAAFREQREDEDGNVIQAWVLFATDGDKELGKVVQRTVSTGDWHGLDLSGIDQYEVVTVEESGLMFPAESRLPDYVPSLAAARARSTAYPHVADPNTWGFYPDCANDACTDVTFLVLMGEQHYPSGTPSIGTQGYRPAMEAVALFDQDGYVAYSYDLETDSGSDPLLALPQTAKGVPANEDGAQGPVVWTPPSTAAAASMGVLAILGAVLYYIWPTAKGGAVGMFSRIRDDQVLDHPGRRQIYEAVQTHPGIHFQDLARTTGSSRGTLAHHLRKIQDSGLIVRQDSSGYVCYFPKGAVDRRIMELAPIVRSRSARRVLDAIARQPGTTCSEVAVAAGIAPATVSYHLGRFRQNGIICTGRDLRLTEHGESVRSAVAG